jgi:hypothetical protein
VSHRFGELATKAQQVFQVGIGPRKFSFRRQTLSYSNRGATRMGRTFRFSKYSSYHFIEGNAAARSQDFGQMHSMRPACSVERRDDSNIVAPKDIYRILSDRSVSFRIA